MSRIEYIDGLTAAGSTDTTGTVTHPVADGVHSAIVRGTTPVATLAPPAAIAAGAGSAARA